MSHFTLLLDFLPLWNTWPMNIQPLTIFTSKFVFSKFFKMVAMVISLQSSQNNVRQLHVNADQETGRVWFMWSLGPFGSTSVSQRYSFFRSAYHAYPEDPGKCCAHMKGCTMNWCNNPCFCFTVLEFYTTYHRSWYYISLQTTQRYWSGSERYWHVVISS